MNLKPFRYAPKLRQMLLAAKDLLLLETLWDALKDTPWLDDQTIIEVIKSKPSKRYHAAHRLEWRPEHADLCVWLLDDDCISTRFQAALELRGLRLEYTVRAAIERLKKETALIENWDDWRTKGCWETQDGVFDCLQEHIENFSSPENLAFLRDWAMKTRDIDYLVKDIENLAKTGDEKLVEVVDAMKSILHQFKGSYKLEKSQIKQINKSLRKSPNSAFKHLKIEWE